MNTHQHILIAGAGFGGVRTALQLARSTPYKISIVTDQADFRYYPALYATATGHSYNESIIPLDEIFAEYPNVTIEYDRITQIDTSAKHLTGESGKQYTYDALVMALGVVTNFFGIEGIEKYAYGIKGKSDIADLKAHLHKQIAEKEQLDDNYVIIGGGPTGVELSGAFGAYLAHLAQCHDVTLRSKIHLIEAAPRLLPRMTERTSALVEKRLKDLGVELHLGVKVESETADAVMISGESLNTHTVVWTSGVANNPFFKENSSSFTLAPNGRVQVDAFLQAAPSVYIIGDNAATPYSGLAQTALYDADFVAGNLKRALRQQAPKAYKAKKPPVVIPVGSNWSVVEWGSLVFAGFPGSLLRQTADLIGYQDILPFMKALRLWQSTSHIEEECDDCRAPIEEKNARQVRHG